MTQITKVALLARVEALEKSFKREAGERKRLEKALADSLEQQTATSEILRVISSSPTDIQPVLDALAESAARLCESFDSAIFRRDGERLLLVAHHGPIPVAFTLPLVRGSVNGRAVLDGRAVHVADLQAEADEFPEGSALTREEGVHAHLSVPLMREGVAIGTINLRRTEAQLFTERQVALLQTFADQAVIAIENVRLFKELEARNRDLTEALDRQTATAEILRVISSSPTDIQPVFDTIADNAVSLFRPWSVAVYRFDGEFVHVAAVRGGLPGSEEYLRGQGPRRPTRNFMAGRCIIESSVVHIPDFETAGDVPAAAREIALLRGFKATLTVPMLKEGQPIGVISVSRSEAGVFSQAEIDLLQTFADQAVIAIENVRLFTELQQKNEALTQAHAQVSEALDQQTATGEILRVISRSQTDLQAVFDSIAESSLRLCGALFSSVYRFDGELVHMVAQHNYPPAALELSQRVFPARPSRQLFSARAILERAVVHVADILADENYAALELVQSAGFRSALAVPMMRGAEPIGAIGVWHADVGPFTDKHIALLKTFADQAVIAIENVRLFTELQEKNRALTAAHVQVSEALEQQTATAEILRVISSSPTDLQPVLATVAENAARVCGANDAQIFRVEGDVLCWAASYGPIAPYMEKRPINRGWVSGRAVVDRRTIHVPDLAAESDTEYPVAKTDHRVTGHRTTLATPLLREGIPLGVIVIRRLEVLPFSERQVRLLETFADQAVIAIENVRLFTELQEKNKALTDAHAQVTETLEQQTATSEILRVISGSPTDVQPVFDTIVRSAVALCGGLFSALHQFDGELLHFVAQHNLTPEALEAIHRVFPTRPSRARFSGRAILDRAVVHVPDIEVDPEFQQSLSRALGFRSSLWVPMLREDAPIGVIVVVRAEPRPFSDNEIELMKTFADQAVIAIENVRLFTELQTSNRELTAALDQQTATGDILRVIASSPTDLQPVFDAILHSACRLCDAQFGALQLFDGEYLSLDGHYGITPDDVAILRQRVFPMRADQGSLSGRAVLSRTVVHIEDVRADPAYRVPVVKTLEGYRTFLSAPMLRKDVVVGVINLWRPAVRSFSQGQIEMVQTFADQAVIAIENVRLFTELQQKNEALTQAHAQVTEALEQQTATSEILKVIASSPTDSRPVFETIVHNAASLCASEDAVLFLLDGAEMVVHAQEGAIGGAIGDRQPIEGTVGGRTVSSQRVVHIEDLAAADEFPAGQEICRRFGHRTILSVPLVREGVALGAIMIRRTEVRPFSDQQVALLKTFADQAVIAIENVRLFKELETRNAELTDTLARQTATGEVLRAISRAQTDAQPVFDIIAESALRLCGAGYGQVALYDGALLHMTAFHNVNPEGVEALRRRFPAPADAGSAMGRALQTRAVVQIPDVLEDPAYAFKTELQTMGFQSLLVVPMLRKDEPIGAIAVGRLERGAFQDKQIELLKTFADQAVIAIENVRLFKELEARTGELTRSVDQLTALGEISQAVSSTLDVETVLQTIVSRASQLAGADGCAIYEYDDATEAFHIRATHNLDPVLVETLRAAPLRKGEGAMGRAAETREPTQVADIAAPGAYQSHIRDTLLGAGYRALLSVPLLREGEIIGSLSLNRHTPGAFPPEVVEVLKTFATQSALAIQNARLFREIADKSRQLEVASQHKSEFLANMSHELRTPLNAVIGFSEVLLQRMFGALNDKQDEYLKDIYASGQHLLSLINDILDLSKIEAGRMELVPALFHLPSALDNAVTLVRERAARHGIALHLDLDPRLGELVGDERKVKQVLLNLLSNAVKFTSEGGQISLKASRRDGAVEIAVTDTGIGIAPEDQAAIFEEFRQVGSDETRKQEGTGLGLTLAKKFVELHGGRIWVESEVGRGSTFTFTLPVS